MAGNEATGTAVTDRVKRRFAYLVEDYHFRVVDEDCSPDAMGNCIVEFRSSASGIRIVIDRGQVLVSTGPLSDPADSWLDIEILIGFLNKGFTGAVYDFPEEWDEYTSMIDQQLARLAGILRQHAVKLLTGEFRGWLAARRFAHRAGEQAHRSLEGR